MIEAIQEILGGLGFIVTFAINIIKTLLMVIGFLASSISFPMSIVPYMPPIIGTAIVVFLAIFIAKFLIGR